jgi:uncharacterized protein (DUF1778 family)
MKKNHFVMIRVDLEEKERLEKLAKIEGCSTLTDFCRQRLFQSLSTDIKLNKILELLNTKGGKRESENGRAR